jgi:ubiquinone/menaquinone biosynthesis C-methylase UbiE
MQASRKRGFIVLRNSVSNKPMSDIDGLQSLYSQIAHQYEQRVIPVFGPLSAHLAAWISRCVDAHLRVDLHDPFDLAEESITDLYRTDRLRGLSALDLGTGTGILARTLAPSIGHMIGVDLSPQMLSVAATYPHDQQTTQFLGADAHHLPLARGAVDLAISSFGLNASTPRKVLRSIARVLRPGKGILAFQEWGALDPASKLVEDVLNEYVPDEVPGVDAALARLNSASKPWYDHLQYAEDFYEMLKEVGFDLVWVKEAPFASVHLPSIETFLTYKLAWPVRRLSIEAMDQTKREAFYADVRARLSTHANPDGSFDWSPPLFRVFAVL